MESKKPWKEAYQAGAQAWPTVTLSFVAFEAHCKAIQEKAGSDPNGHPADTFLACACGAGQAKAIQLLESRYLAHLGPWCARVCAEPAFVDEVLQRLREKLLVGPEPKIRSYSAIGRLEAWLRLCATRTALDLAKARGLRVAKQTELSEKIADPTDPELQVLRRQYRAAFEKAVQLAFRELSPRERRLLELSLVSGWTVTELGRACSVDRSTAARWVASARDRVRQLTLAHLQNQLGGLSKSEFNSIFRALEGELDLHVSSIFSNMGVDEQDRDPLGASL